MNETTQATEGEGPRRSGRERRQAESIYTDARLAERKNRAEKSSERSIRYRKRKGKEDESEEENEQESTTFSDDEVMQFSSDSDNEQESSDSEGATSPNIVGSWEWTRSSVRAVESFSSVDGDNIFYTNYWNGYRRSLSYDAGQSLENAQRSLVDRQHDKQSLTLEHYPKYLSQVPYHADMMPCYEYFAEGIQHRTSLEEFKVINYNLPQSPWLEKNILSVLEQNRKLTVLELSNCSLSADDLTLLTKFVAENKTLSTLNISRTNIESEDAVKALASAFKNRGGPAPSKIFSHEWFAENSF